jgi:hypothetical protein
MWMARLSEAMGVFARYPAQLSEKGDRHLLPGRPSGCFAQKVPVPFSVPQAAGSPFIYTGSVKFVGYALA